MSKCEISSAPPRSVSVRVTILPVVPVQTRWCRSRISQFQSTHSARSRFMLSWATSATFFFSFIVIYFQSSLPPLGRIPRLREASFPTDVPVSRLRPSRPDKTGESGIGASQPETKIIQKTNRQNGRPRILHFDNKKPPASRRTAGTDCERRAYSSSVSGSLNSVNPAPSRMLYHMKTFFMSDTCTRSRS